MTKLDVFSVSHSFGDALRRAFGRVILRTPFSRKRRWAQGIAGMRAAPARISTAQLWHKQECGMRAYGQGGENIPGTFPLGAMDLRAL